MIKQTIGEYFKPYFAEINSKIAQIEADLDKLKAEIGTKNKCTWKKDIQINDVKWMYKTECNNRIATNNDPLSDYYMSHCPFCGKEIEIEEAE